MKKFTISKSSYKPTLNGDKINYLPHIVSYKVKCDGQYIGLANVSKDGAEVEMSFDVKKSDYLLENRFTAQDLSNLSATLDKWFINNDTK